jgi:hypothetical protein
MPTTSPDSIYYADGTTPASLADITAAMATSVQNALNVREEHSFSWANTTAKSAQTGMEIGDIGYQIDNEVFYIYNGSAWKIWAKAPATYTPTFTNFTASSSSFSFSVSSGIVNVSGHVISSSTVSGEVRLSLPIGFNVNSVLLPTSSGVIIGVGGVDDASSTTNFSLGVRVSAADAVALVANAYNASGTGTLYSTIVPTSATIPLTWAVNDVFNVNFSYPVA